MLLTTFISTPNSNGFVNYVVLNLAKVDDTPSV